MVERQPRGQKRFHPLKRTKDYRIYVGKNVDFLRGNRRWISPVSLILQLNSASVCVRIRSVVALVMFSCYLYRTSVLISHCISIIQIDLKIYRYLYAHMGE